MVYLNCKDIELKTSTHMLLAGEDKDMMQIRKEGKKWLSFILKKNLDFPAWFNLQYQKSVTTELQGRYSVGWLVGLV